MCIVGAFVTCSKFVYFPSKKHILLTEIIAGRKSRKVFNQNSGLLIPARVRIYQIYDFNFPKKLSFTQFATLNTCKF